MSPEEVKMSKLSAEVTLAQIGTTAERIRAMTANVARHPSATKHDVERRKPLVPAPAPSLPPDYAPRPTTWEGYCKAARKAVELHKAGHTRRLACQIAGLTESLSTGITHVVGKTALFRCIKAGKLPPADAPRQMISFIRWYLGITCPSHIHGEDTEALRTRLAAGGYVLAELSAASGVHATSIQKFRAGTVKGMRQDTRAKLWEALK